MTIMNRKDFLSKLSMGAAFALTASCLGACSSTDDNVSPSQPSGEVDFELDLSDASNSALLVNGGYLIKNQVVVAKDNNGDYVAATQRCSHENLNRIVLKNDEWYCLEHSAKFSLDGKGLNSKGKNGLTVYQTRLNGSILRVFS